MPGPFDAARFVAFVDLLDRDFAQRLPQVTNPGASTASVHTHVLESGKQLDSDVGDAFKVQRDLRTAARAA